MAEMMENTLYFRYHVVAGGYGNIALYSRLLRWLPRNILFYIAERMPLSPVVVETPNVRIRVEVLA